MNWLAGGGEGRQGRKLSGKQVVNAKHLYHLRATLLATGATLFFGPEYDRSASRFPAPPLPRRCPAIRVTRHPSPSPGPGPGPCSASGLWSPSRHSAGPAAGADGVGRIAHLLWVPRPMQHAVRTAPLYLPTHPVPHYHADSPFDIPSSFRPAS